MDFSPCSSTSSFSSTTSSTLSSSSSSNHAASLVHPSLHSPAIMDLIDVKISRSLIGKSEYFSYTRRSTHNLSDYMVDCVAETVDYAMGRPSPSSSHRGRKSRRSEYTKFTTFVTNVITRAEVATPVYLAALVYIDRARPHLHIALEEWALERVFLGSLIVASKVCIPLASWSLNSRINILSPSTSMIPRSRTFTGLCAPVCSESVTSAVSSGNSSTS